MKNLFESASQIHHKYSRSSIALVLFVVVQVFSLNITMIINAKIWYKLNSYLSLDNQVVYLPWLSRLGTPHVLIAYFFMMYFPCRFVPNFDVSQRGAILS